MIQFFINDIYLGLMIFTRLYALITSVPVFSSKVIPMPAKIALTGTFALFLIPLLSLTGAVPSHILGLVVALSGEILIGILMGFGARLVFFAVEFASEIMAQQSALMRSSSFDPMREMPATTLAPLYTFLAIVIFFITGTHLEMLGAFVRSFDFAPAGMGLFTLERLEDIVRATSGVFVLGLKMSAPLIALAFVINFVFAILGKIAPKFNVMILSFGVRIIVSIFLLYSSVRLLSSYIMLGLEGTALRMLEFIVQR